MVVIDHGDEAPPVTGLNASRVTTQLEGTLNSMAKVTHSEDMSQDDPQEGSSKQNTSTTSVYDPDQNPKEKRQIRRDLRKLLEEANEQKANIKNIRLSDIHEGIAKGNSLFHRVKLLPSLVKDTSEATLDSKFLMIASDMGAAKAKAMKNDGGGFDVDDFVAKLVTFMGGRTVGTRARNDEDFVVDDDDDDDDDSNGDMLNWERIGRLAMSKTRKVPVIGFMLGPLSAEQKQRKKVTRVKFEKSKEVERAPQQLTEEDIQRSENETTKNVKMLSDLLEEQGRTNLFHFITNPHDFGQTVENLFYLSFLIREGTCALEFDEETEEPIIFLCDKPTPEDYNEGIRRQQIIMELDMATWKRAIEVFKITEPIIKHRQRPQEQGTGRWIG
ncbi:hypothetical protein Clacol_006849 [Clathrus columnatus]|uniref:Non-structural maintenance of chromosomes element 4 n=1 Tax=Clathrus columnatus TaxID=1419009 RepID=A0AAV5AJE8_9AGAM|nr:hypothetical protein Clacol_006849 [Clathrus columnatus]